MAVAVAYRNNHNNYFNNSVGSLLAKTGIDILGKLLGDEFNAMRERAANANRVNAFRGIMGALNGTGGENGSTVPTTQEPMSKYDYLTKFLSHPDFAKLSKEQQESLYGYAGVGGQEKGYRDYLENTPEPFRDVSGRVIAQARTNPNGNITDVSNSGLVDRTNQRTKPFTVTTQNKTYLFNGKEYSPITKDDIAAEYDNGISEYDSGRLGIEERNLNENIRHHKAQENIALKQIAASMASLRKKMMSGGASLKDVDNYNKLMEIASNILPEGDPALDALTSGIFGMIGNATNISPEMLRMHSVAFDKFKKDAEKEWRGEHRVKNIFGIDPDDEDIKTAATIKTKNYFNSLQKKKK